MNSDSKNGLGVERTKVSSSSPTAEKNKLECLPSASFFQDSLIFTNKAWSETLYSVLLYGKALGLALKY